MCLLRENISMMRTLSWFSEIHRRASLPYRPGITGISFTNARRFLHCLNYLSLDSETRNPMGVEKVHRIDNLRHSIHNYWSSLPRQGGRLPARSISESKPARRAVSTTSFHKARKSESGSMHGPGCEANSTVVAH